MKFSESIQKLDRRYIYIVVALAVIIPLIFPLGLKTYLTTPVEDLYKHIDEIAGRDDMAILIDFAQSPSTMPELYPMDIAILRHCFQRRIKVFTIAYFPQGAAIVEMALAEVKEDFPEIKQDVDYCNFGYKSGYMFLPIVLGMGDDIAKAVETNSEGNMLENLPIMEKIKNYDNIQVIIEITGSTPGISYITYARGRFGVDVAVGVTAVSAADVYPYLQTGQLIGSLGGLKGAAEYEELVQTFAMQNLDYSKKNASDVDWREKQYSLSSVPYKYKKARVGMDTQAVVHVLIILFIVIGNIGYFIEKRTEKHKYVK
ncbi:MAG: hypothetical protein ISS28_01795 [Candidatus Cloacimonetes bacterium]|nr:hypothetical protein [Candidatus Cloacimonadota bacterium]MBL7085821.1 hypothetical protein [Candidatus Cloacimonadota bacterium]